MPLITTWLNQKANLPMTNQVIYQGVILAKSSEALALWEAKKWKELDALMASCRAAAIKRGEIRAD